METTDLIIDLALNVIGFLAAGVLSVTIYSIFRRDSRSATPKPAKAKVAATETAAPGTADATPSAKRTARPGKVQFVGFGEGSADSAAGRDPLRRNRTDVLRIAREMIRTGSTAAEIKAALPVSDAELAVLDYERK